MISLFQCRPLLTVAYLAIATAALGSPGAFAQVDKSPEYAKGQALAGVCAGCHGVDGNSVVPTQPNLAGMSAQYIARQLSHFKSGQRDNAIMKGFAANLSDEDMKALGVYYGAQKARTVGTRDEKLARTAERLYRAGDATRAIPACAGCHTPTGAGIPAQYPRIGGQHAEYIAASLTGYKTGLRGVASKTDANATGKIMVSIASRLTDAEIKALAEYSAALKPN
jgi:cytochrome c553